MMYSCPIKATSPQIIWRSIRSFINWTKWHYARSTAMDKCLLVYAIRQIIVHKPIGIEDGKVDLSIEKLPKHQQEVVLLSKQYAFLKAYTYENFGDIGKNIKRMVDEVQQLANNQNIRTIADRAKFGDNYPAYRKMLGNISKHVTLVTETIKIVEEQKLMVVSETAGIGL